jgi:hypothetical protein
MVSLLDVWRIIMMNTELQSNFAFSTPKLHFLDAWKLLLAIENQDLALASFVRAHSKFAIMPQVPLVLMTGIDPG